MKSLFNEYEALMTTEGTQAEAEINRYLDDFFDRWIAMGYSTREIQSIVIDTAVNTSAEKRLRKAMGMRNDLNKRKVFKRGEWNENDNNKNG